MSRIEYLRLFDYANKADETFLLPLDRLTPKELKVFLLFLIILIPFLFNSELFLCILWIFRVWNICLFLNTFLHHSFEIIKSLLIADSRLAKVVHRQFWRSLLTRNRLLVGVGLRRNTLDLIPLRWWRLAKTFLATLHRNRLKLGASLDFQASELGDDSLIFWTLVIFVVVLHLL